MKLKDIIEVFDTGAMATIMADVKDQEPVVLFKGLLYELPYCIALSHEDWIVRRINTISGNEIEVFLMPGGENDGE